MYTALQDGFNGMREGIFEKDLIQTPQDVWDWFNQSNASGVGTPADVSSAIAKGVEVTKHDDELMWIIIESTLLLCILCGNILTICAVIMSRRLARASSSQFVLSLAIADFLVAFFLPFHISFYVYGGDLGSKRTACLLKFCCMIFAFLYSLTSIICISVDRYIYILHPLHYTTYVTKRIAWTVISVICTYSLFIAILPLFWNQWETATSCETHQVLPLNYCLFVVAPNFGVIWSVMAAVYWRIIREAKSVRRRWGEAPGKPSERKSIQVVFLVMGSFTVCWMPFFAVMILRAAGLLQVQCYPTLYKGALVLAMGNSCMNPIIYAWKNVEFLHAFSQLLRCRTPSAEPSVDSVCVSGHGHGHGHGHGLAQPHL